MNARTVLIAALLVAVLLPVSLVTMSSIYYAPLDVQSHGVAHESASAFDSTVNEAELEPDNATPLAELSSATQRAFDEPRTEMTDAESGWQEITVTVCHDSLLVCPAYDEAPGFPEDGMKDPGARTGNNYGLVEADGERYVVETRYGTGPGFAMLSLYPVMVFSFVLYGLFLGATAYRYHDTQPSRVLGCTGYGLLLLCWPYLVVAAYALGVSIHFLYLPVAAVGGIVGMLLWYGVRKLIR